MTATPSVSWHRGTLTRFTVLGTLSGNAGEEGAGPQGWEGEGDTGTPSNG
jgi:hypothetical protein